MPHSAIQEENAKKLLKIPSKNDILKDYEEVPVQAVAASKWLVEIWERLGKPTSPFTESGQKVVDVIIATWKELYPRDVEDFFKNRTEYQTHELSISEQVSKKTGRSLASIPIHVFYMMKVVFPTFKFDGMAGRKNTMSFVKRWRMFQMANKA